MNYSIRSILVTLFGLLACGILKGQTLPVGTPVLEDWYRRAQLLGEVDSTVSFCSRPLFPEVAFKTANRFDPDSTLTKSRWNLIAPKYSLLGKTAIFELLPVTFLQQFNSDHAAGINDGLMIPAKGYQTLVSGGIYFKFGPLSIQLRPEYVYAVNLTEAQTTHNGIAYNQQIDVWYKDFLWKIDMPDHFGKKPYSTVSWGQSSILLTLGTISLGLSNENLWWGPGLRNTLMMTNNAPGFKHFTLNTVKPIHTSIGSFEGQIIAGRLEGSGFSPDKPSDWRYLNGIAASYQPRWVHGLFLGITRTYQSYKKDLGNTFNDYFPIFDFITKNESTDVNDKTSRARDQIASLFMRWFWSKGQAEIYFEYGREDHAWNLRDLMMEPTSSAAYNLGFRKLIIVNNHNTDYFQINMEATQLEMDNITINRQGSAWYTHYPVLSGYTNYGQVLGAGIGPGSNMQTIHVSWHRKLKSIGLEIERYEHNNDFFQIFIKDIRTNWVDLSAALLGEWNWHNLLLNVKLETIRSKNYKWQFIPIQPSSSDFFKDTHDVMNFHGELGITYRF